MMQYFELYFLEQLKCPGYFSVLNRVWKVCLDLKET